MLERWGIMNSIQRIISYFDFYKKYIGNKIFFVFFLSAFSGILEGVGLVMLAPLLEIYFGQGLLDSGIFSYVQPVFDYFHISFTVKYVSVLVIFLILSKGVLIFSALSYASYLKGVFLFSIKKELIFYFSNLKYSYYLHKTVGYFTNVVNEQANKATGGFTSLMGMLVSLVGACIYIIIAFTITWQLSGLIIVGAIFLYWSFKWINNYTSKKSRDIANLNGMIGKYFIELLEGYKYLTSTGQRSKFLIELLGIVEKSSKNYYQMGVAGAFIYAMREPIILTLILILAGFQIYAFDSEISSVLVAIFLFYRAFNTLMSVQMGLQSIFEISGSIDLVSEEINELAKNQENRSGDNRVFLTSKLHIKDLHLSYPGATKPALNSVSMNINAGETVAIVGSSGAGKTSLADLFCFLQQPNLGLFQIDGVPNDDCDTEFWRQHIGYVSQDAPIFDNSIIGNITMENSSETPSQKILDAAILAAKMSNIHDVIEALPKGYFTRIGEGGQRLSGGQKQRLMIARELYRRPSLLILDEATSSLDAESEVAIQKRIDSLKSKLTVIIIAHRLSTVKNVDRIYVMESGSILEEGTYTELSSRKNSRLFELIKLQSL